jgi:hypothetical protein
MLAQAQQQLLGAKQARHAAKRRVAALSAERNRERELLVRAAGELTQLHSERNT